MCNYGINFRNTLYEINLISSLVVYLLIPSLIKTFCKQYISSTISILIFTSFYIILILIIAKLFSTKIINYFKILRTPVINCQFLYKLNFFQIINLLIITLMASFLYSFWEVVCSTFSFVGGDFCLSFTNYKLMQISNHMFKEGTYNDQIHN